MQRVSHGAFAPQAMPEYWDGMQFGIDQAPPVSPLPHAVIGQVAARQAIRQKLTHMGQYFPLAHFREDDQITPDDFAPGTLLLVHHERLTGGEVYMLNLSPDNELEAPERTSKPDPQLDATQAEHTRISYRRNEYEAGSYWTAVVRNGRQNTFVNYPTASVSRSMSEGVRVNSLPRLVLPAVITPGKVFSIDSRWPRATPTIDYGRVNAIELAGIGGSRKPRPGLAQFAEFATQQARLIET